MENNIIMSMKTKIQDYSKNTFIATVIAAPLLLFGAIIFILALIYDYSDEASMIIIGVILLYVGIDVGQIAMGNFSKLKKSKITYLDVTQSEVKGQINGKDFAIKHEDIVSVSIQVCSVDCDFDGVPKNMSPGMLMKLYGQTNKYLCIFTNTGKTYYIDCLTSPETAKNTIDSIAAKVK